MTEQREETEPRDAYVWTIFSLGGVYGVRCVYDKKSRWLSVERDCSGTSRYVATLSKARVVAREMAAQIFASLSRRNFLREVQQLVEREL